MSMVARASLSRTSEEKVSAIQPDNRCASFKCFAYTMLAPTSSFHIRLSRDPGADQCVSASHASQCPLLPPHTDRKKWMH